MANTLIVIRYSLSIILCCSPLFGWAKSCADTMAVIEQRLFHEPDNAELRFAWLALQHCREVPVESTAKQQQQLSVWVGQDTNPLHTSSADTLWLTTSAGWLGLPNLNQPVSSRFEQLGWFYQHTQPNQQQFSVQVQAKHYQESAYQNQHQGSLRYQWPVSSKAFLHTSYQWVNVDTMLLRQLSVLYQMALTQQWSLGVEARLRRFIDDGVLDGNAPFVHLNWQSDDRLWWLNYALGVDQPVGMRAGGAYRLHELAMGTSRLWLNQWWDVMLYARHQQDESAYSPLLNANTVRTLYMSGALLQWRGEPWYGLVPSAQIEYAQQQANIALFDWHTSVFRLGFHYAW